MTEIGIQFSVMFSIWKQTNKDNLFRVINNSSLVTIVLFKFPFVKLLLVFSPAEENFP